MTLLTSTERLNIVINEDDLNAGKAIYHINFNGRTYFGGEPYNCESHPEAKNLYKYIVEEYKNALPAADAEFEKLVSKVGKVEKKESTPKKSSSSLGDKLEEMLLKVIAEQSVEQIVENCKPLLEKHIIETFGVLPQVHEVKTPTQTKKIEGAVHEMFDKVLNLVNLDIPVFLSGAAGTGKNVICKQVAEALNLDFYFTNAVTQEYQLKGFIDANGTFHETQFYKAFTNGGLFFLDEMDGSIPETLIILNAAIANRYFDFPTGKVEAHPNFRVISAGNTVGTGADIEYTGRFQLDASSLDRFALIHIDYSKNIEAAVTNNNTELLDFARKFREITIQSGIKCLCSYRSLERITKLEGVFELPEILEMSLTKGLGKDDIKIIANGFKMNNKYVEALKKLI